MTLPAKPPLADLLVAFGLDAAGASAARAPNGLIQVTWIILLADGSRVVAQRAHPVFDPDGRGTALLGDIEAVTAHLAAAGIITPRLMRVRPGAVRADGPFGWRDGAGKLWRLLTFVDGVTIDRVESAARAGEAAQLVARFHGALADLRHEFAFTRPGAHDTAAHLAKLEKRASTPGKGHDALRRLADDILEEGRTRPKLPKTPARITHGDLKISNLLFTEAGEARALIDLDTLGRLTLAYEMGDALRSWCNPAGEDSGEARFDRDMFEAAIRGYARGLGMVGIKLAAGEAESFAPGLQTVALELSARFCLDAFEDRYFGWDPERFPSRREHNRVRAAGQLALSREAGVERAKCERLIADVFNRPHRGGP